LAHYWLITNLRLARLAKGNFIQRLILFALLTLINSQSFAASWVEGIDLLRQSALTSDTEDVMAYIYVNEEIGVWVTPMTTEKLTARVSIDLQSLIAQISSSVEEIKRRTQEITSIKICFIHTHPLAAVTAYLKDPRHRNDIYRSDVEPKFNTKFTVPPSRTDIPTGLAVSNEVSKQLLELGLTNNIKVIGVVVDPVGIYYFRQFTDDNLKFRLFPSLKNVPNFSDLDQEEQNFRAPIMDKEFFKRKVEWTTFVNQSNADPKDLLHSPIYFELQKFYASYADSTQLRFTNLVTEELPCQGFTD
jgi:hypothetical protein